MKIKKFLKPISLVFLLFFSVYFISGASAAGNEPGTDANPLIAKDYFDLVIKEKDQKIDALTKTVEALSKRVDQLSGSASIPSSGNTYASDSFVQVKLTKGQSLIVGNMTEILLAGPGRGIAIAGKTSGISDIVQGKAIKDGDVMPNNRLYFVPESQNYGVKVMGEISLTVYVKGQYQVK